jgi:hypothetical protein
MTAGLSPDRRNAAARLATLADRGARAMLVTTDPYFYLRRAQIIALAARHTLRAIYDWRDWAEDE